MQYLFFDIECASVSRTAAKICAFGYCLTDENFNILEKEDLLINPKGKFHLTDRKGEAGLVLPYDYAAFKTRPLFPDVFPKIRRLLEGSDKRIFGHATINDVHYLNLETARFKLPALEFHFFDTQVMYMSRMSAYEKALGLEPMAQALGVEFTPHRAADDAYATMRVAQAMCEKDGLSMEAFLKHYALQPGKTKNGVVTAGTSRGMRQFLQGKKREKEARQKQRLQFCRLIDRKNNGRVSPGCWRNEVFAFSREIEENFALAKSYVDAVYRRGGRCSTKARTYNVYVRAETDDGQRYQNAVNEGKEIISEDDFRRLLSEEDA